MNLHKAIILVLFLAVSFYIGFSVSRSNPNDLKEIKRLNKELKMANWRDSLYWLHISKCSFISNNQIQVGYGNYLKLIKSSKPE